MIKVFDLKQRTEWDEIVTSFREFDTYWLSGYVKAFEINGDGEPLLLYYEDKTGLRGMNVVMKRDIADTPNLYGRIKKNSLFDFATPYGYGGWIIEGDKSEQLFIDYFRWCYSNNIISEFVRFHPLIKNHECCKGEYDVIKLGQVVHMDITSIEKIWNNLTSKNRNVVRKAIKNDVKIYNGRFPEIYDEFKKIYDLTMDKDNADQYYYFGNDFYQSVLNDLPNNAQVFYAVKDDIVIAASIILSANKRINYHLSGSLREYSSLAATNLLLVKVAEWGCSHGYQTLYLGGGVGSGEDSLFKFKKAFNKNELNSFYIGRKIINEEKYSELCALCSNEGNAGFFPAYRA